MKYIFKSICLIGLTGITLASLTGCGPAYDYQEFDNVIVDQEGDSDGPNLGNVSLEILEGELKAGLSRVIDFEEHRYQYQFTNNIDVFAGYFTVSKSKFDFGTALYHTYSYPNGYYNGPIGVSKNLFPQIYHAYFFGEEHGTPEWKAIAEILYGYSLQELTDFYGVVPYNDYRNLKETTPLAFLSTKDAYNAILSDLEEAISILKTAQPSPEQLVKIEGDPVLKGYSKRDWKNWVKLANSIRLRMALNMVKVEPGRAQEIAESAVNDEIGVLDTEDFGMPPGDNNIQHPLFKIGAVWNDSRLGASLENILKRYNSPLLSKWFGLNEAAIKSAATGAVMLNSTKDFVGMRQGVDVDPSTMPNGYGAFSKFMDQFMPRNIFKVTEVLFLRAEGALRGWNMKGTDKELYEQGIKRVFDENNVVGYDTYIKQEAPKLIPYRDYYHPEFSIEDTSRGVQVGVKWDNADSNETKLEKIITQKYIAIFPFSAEAWTTFRRTGYPRLFTVPEKNTWPDGSFDVELQLRRIPYDATSANDRANIPNIEAALGEKNLGGTRLWWDVPTETRDENNRVIPKNF